MTLICIVRGPTVELRREPAGERWCFGCRKRLPHEDVLFDEEQNQAFLRGEADEPSYYEPIWVRRCSGCGEDRTSFPGCGPA